MNRTRLAALALACLPGLLGLTAPLAQGAEPAPARPALTVSTTRPSQATLPLQLSANGNVAAWQEALVSLEAQGLRLTQVLVNVGDTVRAGQLLARLADETVQADLAQARAALLEAEAHADEAVANASRTRQVQAGGALSEQQISQALSAERAAQARVLAARASVQTQALRLRQTQVLAPDSGVISARSATVGAVPASGTELFRLIRQNRLEWRAEVTAAELPRLRRGTRVRLGLPSGAQVMGEVRQLAPTIDPQTRNALVYVDLKPHPELRPGLFARGEFELGQSPALTLPQQALVVRDGFSYVFELDAQQNVQQRKVETGRRQGEQVEVLRGLAPGATVVLQGAGFLNQGDRVRVSNPPTSGAPAAPQR
ncbi:MAG: efflux RND transporter periplasmic adaptor subunit [Curvibacter lanceolatus]|uniref:efflux RND transporter periplasmic adaptor subunit n=1 Tax=Curvibacter lanceolatus TaxID=86182 RepID=UPI00037A7A37|nr:efflux RND transporter periplasmic adaptor subunit [Curvibacter lanceolatus]MBV5295875.1 efflux RND transporter periplasmic adaptor subunit [Curvibacter lanceolatus]